MTFEKLSLRLNVGQGGGETLKKKVSWKSKDGKLEKILMRKLEMGGQGHLCRDFELEEGGRLLHPCLVHPLLLLLLMLPFVYLK